MNESTYDPRLDRERLKKQGRDVWDVMTAPAYDDWWTLRELAQATGHQEASISARLREMRSPEYGGHFVDRRRRGDPKAGCWEYRLTVRRPPPQQDELRFDAARDGAEAR
jgi:hypothetical protein